MREDSQFKAIFASVVQPKAYIDPSKMAAVIKATGNSKTCQAFIESPDAYEFIEMLLDENSADSKNIIKNILLYSSEQGGISEPWDGNRFKTAELIGKLNKADQKEVLMKNYMIADLVSGLYNYHWNAGFVISLLDKFSKADRLDILCTPHAISGLITFTADQRDINREKVMAWFEEQRETGKARMIGAERAARAFIEAYGTTGIEMAKKYLPEENFATLFLDTKRTEPDCFTFMNLNQEKLELYLNSLSEKDRTIYCDDNRGYLIHAARLRPSIDPVSKRVSIAYEPN